jgi:uncharacterized protein (TIGR02996 family)
MMSAESWQSSADPAALLDAVAARASERKLRLLACACARLVWDGLDERARLAVETAEAFAEGTGTPQALARAGAAFGHPDFDAGPLRAAARACVARDGEAAARRALDVAWEAGRHGTACCDLLRELFEGPGAPVALDRAWLAANDGAAARLARAAYEERAFDRLGILADALEDAGCADQRLLEHLRSPGPHALGCWALDRVLERDRDDGLSAVERRRQRARDLSERGGLFLPHAGWLVRFTRACSEQDNPLGSDLTRHSHRLFASDFPEAVLDSSYPGLRLRGKARVRGIKAVWFLTSDDPAPLPEGVGRLLEGPGGRALLFEDRGEALAALARSSEPVRLLLALSRSAEARVRSLAGLALEGDEAALALLAESGAPEVGAIRGLCGPAEDEIPSSRPPRLDDEHEEARREAERPCPGCARARLRAVRRVRKDGPNQGRLFLKCPGCGRFDWFEPGTRPARDAGLEVAQAQATPCPRCGKPRRALRVRKEGPNQGRLFLGCSDRACDSFEWARATPAGRASGEADLLHAVLAAPEDDRPRRAYADWLARQGQPERADFVRVQCELAGLPEGDERRGELRGREEELAARFGERWAGPVLGLVQGHAFRRGLLEVVEMAAQVFVERARELFQAAPVLALTARVAGLDELAALLASPYLARLRELRLLGPELSSAGARALAGSANVRNLRALAWADQNLGSPGAAALAGSAALSTLTHLDLTHNRMGRGAFAALAESPHLASLTSLVLRRNRAYEPELEALARSPSLARLAALDLGHCGVNPAGLRRLLRSPHLPSLRSLELDGNNIGDEGALALANCAGLSNLRRLGLADTGVGENGLRALLSSPHLARLERLDGVFP